MDCVIPADPKLKLNESKKLDKYLDLTRELKRYKSYISGCWSTVNNYKGNQKD